MEKLNKIPTHVSIIMDGNGRWAQEHGKDRIYGHFEGVESVRSITEACVEYGIKYLSLFAFSEENWQRPKMEVDALMSLMFDNIKKEKDSFMKNGVKLLVLGDRERLSQKLNASIDAIMEQTVANETLTMILFVSYSGKWDIRQAARRMAKEGAQDLEPYLVTAGIPDPDLVIRTSGEKRISNYLLWQAAYSEFVFSPTLWPDFRKERFREALEEYATRDRRFGKVKSEE
jgi:undecaprenyl diphosphate synthase